jgi:hypothetical protein
LNAVSEPGDIPPVANITLTALPNVSPTTVLGCTAASSDPEGFLISSQLRYSNGSQLNSDLPSLGTDFSVPIFLFQGRWLLACWRRGRDSLHALYYQRPSL